MNLSTPAVCLALLVALLSSCASSDSSRSKGYTTTARTLDARGVEVQETALGQYLMRLSLSIEMWGSLVRGAEDGKDQRQAELLEGDLRHRSRKRFEELVDQLRTGPDQNRAIAAAALGFTGYESAVGPLLGALADPAPGVVSNALLGLSQLGQPITPLEPVALCLSEGSDPGLRANAARCLNSVLIAGGSSSEAVLEAVRYALIDEEPAVRGQAALILAHLVDTDSIGPLSLLLRDPKPYVALAASRSLVFIGTTEVRVKGKCARALVGALDDVDRGIRDRMLLDLQRLSMANYGSETKPWVEWAQRLP